MLLLHLSELKKSKGERDKQTNYLCSYYSLLTRFIRRYPVILSIEDNCTLPQQRKMATTMQEVFGDMLLVQPVDKNETCLPSPYALRRKILLKHKKLPDGVDESSFLVRNDESRQEMDLRNTVKNGILYLEDPIDREWNPHFFVLTQQKLFYTDTFSRAQETEHDDDEESGVRRSLDVCTFYIQSELRSNCEVIYDIII